MAQYFTYNNQTIAAGDTVRVHQEVSEGDKTRMQIFEGVVIAIKNRGNNKSFTVRKVGANNIGVEKILPVKLPTIKDIEVKRKGDSKRSKLYYLRDRVGKAATRIQEKSANGQTEETA